MKQTFVLGHRFTVLQEIEKKLDGSPVDQLKHIFFSHEDTRRRILLQTGVCL
jgi:hypothetical protein